MRILMVEDEKKAAVYLQKGLTEQGFVVDVNADGHEGLLLTGTDGEIGVSLDPTDDGSADISTSQNPW